MGDLNNISFFPKFQELKEDLERLNQKLSDLFFERDQLVLVICKNIETAAAKKRPYGDLQKQIVVAAKLQKTLNQQVLLAQAKEAEKLKKKEAQALAKKTRGGNGSDGDRKSGGMSASSGFGSQPGKGGIAAASAGGSGASGKGSSSGSGSESSGNSGGASGAAGDSSGSGSSGTGSGSSGTGDTSVTK